MTLLFRRRFLVLLLAAFAITTVFHLVRRSTKWTRQAFIDKLTHPGFFRARFSWNDVPQRYPVENYTALPSGPLGEIPRVQANFKPETKADRSERQPRLQAVKEAFVHSWEGYKRNAWLQDEVAPLTGLSYNGLGGWGATLVDSLDTLWIMGLKKEFAAAVNEVRWIDFTTTELETINVFETTIRYLGGLLSAYDVSGHEYKILLKRPSSWVTCCTPHSTLQIECQ